MATALFLPLTKLFSAVHAFAAWFAPRPAPACSRAGLPAQRAARIAPAMPLRVVRVVEPSASRSNAGRMVISGRLADVCAELDRLAALEAQGC
jgi:hypothetical protein